MTITPGQVVQLRSGGPKMTVVGLKPRDDLSFDPDVHCRWFDRLGNVHYGIFTRGELIVIGS
jgi:uncharacterized protein YodC (DUF2158 family)